MTHVPSGINTLRPLPADVHTAAVSQVPARMDRTGDNTKWNGPSAKLEIGAGVTEGLSTERFDKLMKGLGKTRVLEAEVTVIPVDETPTRLLRFRGWLLKASVANTQADLSRLEGRAARIWHVAETTMRAKSYTGDAESAVTQSKYYTRKLNEAKEIDRGIEKLDLRPKTRSERRTADRIATLNASRRTKSIEASPAEHSYSGEREGKKKTDHNPKNVDPRRATEVVKTNEFAETEKHHEKHLRHKIVDIARKPAEKVAKKVKKLEDKQRRLDAIERALAAKKAAKRGALTRPSKRSSSTPTTPIRPLTKTTPVRATPEPKPPIASTPERAPAPRPIERKTTSAEEQRQLWNKEIGIHSDTVKVIINGVSTEATLVKRTTGKLKDGSEAIGFFVQYTKNDGSTETASFSMDKLRRWNLEEKED